MSGVYVVKLFFYSVFLFILVAEKSLDYFCGCAGSFSSSNGIEGKNFFETECTTGRPQAMASIAMVSKCSRPAAKLPKTKSLSQNNSFIAPWGTLLIKSMSSLSSFASCFVFSRSFPALKVLTFIFSGNH